MAVLAGPNLPRPIVRFRITQPYNVVTDQLPGSVYLSKLLGGPVEESEARSALQHYGNIEEVWLPSPTEREVYGLAQGIFVKFEYQQDRRKALAVSSCLST
jgi:hypothetical protein